MRSPDAAANITGAMALRLLIVDDNPRFVDAARGLLETEGLRVVAVASNGAEAVARAAETEPDVVLVDIDLGDESGFDVVPRLVRPDGTGAAVILISAYAQQDFEGLLAASPALGFIPKARLSSDAIHEQLVASGDAGST
jgi:CheY-like chemotaxis protein